MVRMEMKTKYKFYCKQPSNVKIDKDRNFTYIRIPKLFYNIYYFIRYYFFRIHDEYCLVKENICEKFVDYHFEKQVKIGKRKLK